MNMMNGYDRLIDMMNCISTTMIDTYDRWIHMIDTYDRLIHMIDIYRLI